MAERIDDYDWLCLLYLGTAKKIEPMLLIPIGFGIILGNLPLAGLAYNDQGGIINILYRSGVLTELFPLFALYRV